MRETRIETIKKLILSNAKVYCENDDMAKEYTQTVYEQLCKEIIEAKKEEYRKEQEKILKYESRKIKITQAKKLLYEGFLVAFFMGVTVNQATDLFGIFKGSIDEKFKEYTLIGFFINLIICISLFFWGYIREVMKYLKSNKED